MKCNFNKFSFKIFYNRIYISLNLIKFNEN